MRLSRLPRRFVADTWTPPVFLCPSLARLSTTRSLHSLPQPTGSALKGTPARSCQRRSVHIETSRKPANYNHNFTASPTATGLPLTCPGCGAYSQTDDPVKVGFYSLTRKPVRAFLRTGDNNDGGGNDTAPRVQSREEDEAFSESVKGLESDIKELLGLQETGETDEHTGSSDSRGSKTPVCDRCHALVNHGHGEAFVHPKVDALAEIVAESPHRRNHIFHLIDAVDFPMSFIKNTHQIFDAFTRSRNRRQSDPKQKAASWTTVTFIITRSDLLAPTQKQVDSLLAPMRRLLQDIINEESMRTEGKLLRIGEVRLVSAMRGWWTHTVKDSIRHHRGGVWLLGKANVGKSKIIELLYPSQPAADSKRSRELKAPTDWTTPSSFDTAPRLSASEQATLLLPPAAPETQYPVMPTVSHQPGTTVQPIRIRYNSGAGEIIDLPGVDRDDMMPFVHPHKQGDLVMRSRVKAEQQVIRPGQSLMVGDLVRITPTWQAWDRSIGDTLRKPDMVMLAAAFVPFKTHVTATEKGIAVQAGERDPSGMYEQLLTPEARGSVASAGKYGLTYDVTKARAGPLTRKDAVGLDPARLPFVVYSADLVIEGVGWVELAFEMRRKQLDAASSSWDDGTEMDGLMPAVEVFTPQGRHVMTRPPLNLFMMGGKRRKPVSQRTQRPRPSMKGVKKELKKRARTPEWV